MELGPDVVEVVKLVPAARSAASLGHSHSIDSALADLVDNAIDANAQHVSIDFLLDGGTLSCIQVRDDGRGMLPEFLKESMRLGVAREYLSASLGHFGVGLKVASLSQAKQFMVVSRAESGDYCGARISTASFEQDYSVEILARDFSAAIFAATRVWGPGNTGTIVEWTGIRSALNSGSSKERDGWLSQRIDHLSVHLGLVYHRLLARNAISIAIGVFDRSTRSGGVPRPVIPFDPFSYRTSSDPAYPRVLRGHLSDVLSVDVGCHVLPAHGESANFRLKGRPGSEWQGLYFYRNDRLIQVGGWDQIVPPSPTLQLARVEIDVPAELLRHVGMSAEKNSVALSPSLMAAIRDSRDVEAGIDFDAYLSSARDVYANSRKRPFTRKPLLPLGRGFDSVLAEKMCEAVGTRPGEEPVDIVWSRLSDGQIFDVDLANRTIRLSDQYRPLLAPTLPGKSSGEEDAPLLKVLLFLLTQEHFAGSRLGPKERDDLEIWNLAMKVAADRIEQQTKDGFYDN